MRHENQTERKFLEAFASAYCNRQTLEQMDAACAKARAEMVAFIEANESHKAKTGAALSVAILGAGTP